MRKKQVLAFILCPLLILIGLLSITACQNSDEIIFDGKDDNNTYTFADNKTPGGEENTYKTNESEEGTYSKVSVSFTDSDKASKPTDVETTVDAVYDSVVSISVVATSFTAAGSGVLFANDSKLSYIVTCFHVIDGAYKYDVKLANGETYSASLVGGNEKTDLAVLSIEKTGLTYAPLYADSDKLKLGSSVVCIGNPLGTLPGSVSAGVLSYVNRKVQRDAYNTQTLLQTDVAINSGNSGGGLFNTSGALIGIVNAKYSASTIEGLGFAIPSNVVRTVVNDILSTAEYNETSKNWHEGYVKGDWSLGFTVSNGYYTTGSGWSARSTACIYISDISSNPTSSKGDLAIKCIIRGVKIKYANNETKSLSEAASADDVLKFIYNANLAVGDTITFTVTTTNNLEATTDVDVPIIQYIYQD